MPKQFKRFLIIGKGRFLGSVEFAKSIRNSLLNYIGTKILITLPKAHAFITGGIPQRFRSISTIFRNGTSSQVAWSIVRFKSIDMINKWCGVFVIGKRPCKTVGKIASLLPVDMSVSIGPNRSSRTGTRNPLLDDAPIEVSRYWIESQKAFEFIQRQKIVMNTWCSHVLNSNGGLTIGQAANVG